ncbi:hypothetical protein [Melittangium boletus]|uniref:Outer membrane protein beta-barrel domain-containing protein n=1 Tax=Melittangium boletus DSM 14713 TaxID=1294270 RepID=A0A250IBG5_9BACT|nr:hypothetical protein [Melittangium boletus]ATB28573.1 hypothetical protein MEBOL_002022 [Melittangium boletus DSM 14713]
MTPTLPPRKRRARGTPRVPVPLCLLLLMMSPDARAQSPEEPRPPTEEPEITPAPPPTVPVDDSPPWSTRFGLRLGVGAPEGVGAAAIVHPRPWLRVHVGGARNYLGASLRGGVDLLPIRLFMSPVLGLTYGHAFDMDYEGLLSRLHGEPTSAGTAIRRVEVDQLSATLGLEFSPWRPVTFFGVVGISYAFIRVADPKAFIREAEEDPELSSTPLHLGISTPVARLGVILYFN